MTSTSSGDVGSRAASVAAAAAASIYSQEGANAGPRAAQLAKERQHLLEQAQRERDELMVRSAVPDAATLRDVGRRFQREVLQTETSERPYGLQTQQEFLAAQQRQAELEAGQLAALGHGQLKGLSKSSDGVATSSKDAERKERKKRKKERQRKDRALLSFEVNGDDNDFEDGQDDLKTAPKDDDSPDNDEFEFKNADDENKAIDDEKHKKRKRKRMKKSSTKTGYEEVRVCKNPDVETGFLPDRERDEQRRREEEHRRAVREAEEAKEKAEMLTITYSYWTGEGNRDRITVTKGTTVSDFLEKVRLKMMKVFPSLRAASADTLMYIKEDMIIPNFLTFYDLIKSNARGLTGPLNKFTVEEDVRLQGDIRVANRESHAGKVCDRHWYNKNKHIYPASRWEVFDPTKLEEEEEKKNTKAISK